MKMYLVIALCVQFAFLSQVSCKCTDQGIKEIHDCRGGILPLLNQGDYYQLFALFRTSLNASTYDNDGGGGHFYYIYNAGENGISGILLTNLTENTYDKHCQLLTEYSNCVSKVSDECHTLMQTDAFFEGIIDYYKYVCAKARTYQDYAAAVECKETISQMDAVQTCDKEAQKISRVPGNYEGVCSNVTSWLDCYTKATSEKCMKTQDGKTAIYVMTSQFKLVQKTAEAAKCQGQDFQKFSDKYTEETSSSAGSGWIHAVWISLLAICLATGVLIYIVNKKRKGAIPRQRLVNEVA